MMDIEQIQHATILLVDDTPANLGVLFDYLSQRGFTVKVVQSGESALDFMQTDKPDIILLDIIMPGMDGFEACRRLKETDDTRDIPVIFMSALSETVDKVKGFEVGGVDYISKPFQVEEVLARVTMHVTLQNLQRNCQEKNIQLQQEINQRQQAEDQLRVLSRAVEQSASTIVITDLHGTIEFVNPEFSKTTGYSYEEAIGKNPRILKSGKQSPELYQELWKTISQGEVWRGEFINKRKNGEFYWEYVTISPVKDQEGNITHYVGVKEDITARKRAEEELRRLNQQLKEANASKDKFFSILAHDLRGPLGSLHLLIEVMVENIKGYSQEELIRMLLMQGNAAKNLFALLENLLSWSRVQRGVIEYRPQRIGIEGIVARNVDLLTPNAQQKQITLRNSIKEKTVVYADVNMMETVVRNLVSNALKFTHPGGTVEVAARQDQQVIEVSVSDTGIGIDEQYLPILFQIDAEYKRPGTAREKGTGLGLILCKEFIEKNGGTIRVKSEVGTGTTFTFTLPKESGI